MKTRSWILLLADVALIFGILGTVLLHTNGQAQAAEIYSEGQLLKTVSLAMDQEFTVENTHGGSNTVTVKNGKIAVTSATCPDHYCMHRGFCSGGAPIICLPNALEIRFLKDSPVDISIG